MSTRQTRFLATSVRDELVHPADGIVVAIAIGGIVEMCRCLSEEHDRGGEGVRPYGRWSSRLQHLVREGCYLAFADDPRPRTRSSATATTRCGREHVHHPFQWGSKRNGRYRRESAANIPTTGTRASYRPRSVRRLRSCRLSFLARTPLNYKPSRGSPRSVARRRPLHAEAIDHAADDLRPRRARAATISSSAIEGDRGATSAASRRSRADALITYLQRLARSGLKLYDDRNSAEEGEKQCQIIRTGRFSPRLGSLYCFSSSPLASSMRCCLAQAEYDNAALIP